MADTHETAADIIAEIRALSNTISDGIIAINGRSIADRLDAAHRRERGDAAKLREALEKIHTIAKTFIDATKMRRVTDSARLDVSNIKDLADAALATLAAPPRNCDRLEAAHRRERGNAAKLREALDESRRIASDLGGCRLNDYWKLNEIVRVCTAALAAPPRNCDIVPIEASGAADIFHRERPLHGYDYETHDWLLAPATEKEGGAI